MSSLSLNQPTLTESPLAEAKQARQVPPASPLTESLVAGSTARHPNYFYIDCVRGYAVFFVIVMHVQGVFPDLPWRFREVLQMGARGVQLFFLASCVTLMMSWNHDYKPLKIKLRSFFIRRFLRIAPAYYLAALVFLLIHPPQHGFQPWHFLASLFFVNSWHPVLLSTVDEGWKVVPGGWSISVEFMFYCLFPLIASLVTNLTRALWFFIVAIILGVVVNEVTQRQLQSHYSADAVTNFLFFWLPNQLCVFALGTILYFCLTDRKSKILHELRVISRVHGNWLSVFILFVFAMLSLVPLAKYLGLSMPFVPVFLVSSLLFSVWIFILSETPPGFMLHPLVAALGKVSFSAYLVHFGIIYGILEKYPRWFGLGYSHIFGMGVFCVVLAGVTLLTYGISLITYHAIELPMMELAKQLTRNKSNAASTTH